MISGVEEWNVKLLSKALILILIQSRYNFDPKNLISIKRLLFKFYSHLLSIKDLITKST